MRAPSSPASPPARKPPWLKVRFPSGEDYAAVASLVREHRLNTICRSARCPNVGECWNARTATFLILGDVCTRACAFCAVAKGAPAPLEPGEPAEVAEAAAALGLAYVVVTSVTRDDLPDGGASRFVEVIAALKRRLPGARIEVLVPDFGGDEAALRAVLEAGPDVLNHNLETVEALYPVIGRPAGNYRRSLRLLERAAASGAVTKSGLMIGLGEGLDDLRRTFRDLRAAGGSLLTVGQYLQPTREHAPVVRYWEPEAFEALKAEALAMGFAGVAAGPLVRSSFQAQRLYGSLSLPGGKRACVT